MSKAPALLLAALALSFTALTALTAGTSTAEAKGRVHIGVHVHRHAFVPRPLYRGVTVVRVGPSCGWLWRRYEITGNVYWKDRYYACIG